MAYVNGVRRDGIIVTDGCTFIVEDGDDVIEDDISTMTSRLEGWTLCQECWPSSLRMAIARMCVRKDRPRAMEDGNLVMEDGHIAGGGGQLFHCGWVQHHGAWWSLHE